MIAKRGWGGQMKHRECVGNSLDEAILKGAVDKTKFRGTSFMVVRIMKRNVCDVISK